MRLVALDTQNAGFERVQECSSAVVICAEDTREPTPEPSIRTPPDQITGVMRDCLRAWRASDS
jgi:hypothetical protein